AIGSIVGGILGGRLVQHYVKESSHPESMWWIVAGIGFASAILMVLYDLLVASRPAADRKETV
ncbi:MAG TPA: hypothetical protein VLR69_09710, partial [Thermoanaerobaculia bacterium]|nr:hypothetical protein [Thermoanaerobaculia bacterium]